MRAAPYLRPSSTWPLVNVHSMFAHSEWPKRGHAAQGQGGRGGLAQTSTAAQLFSTPFLGYFPFGGTDMLFEVLRVPRNPKEPGLYRSAMQGVQVAALVWPTKMGGLYTRVSLRWGGRRRRERGGGEIMSIHFPALGKCMMRPRGLRFTYIPGEERGTATGHRQARLSVYLSHRPATSQLVNFLDDPQADVRNTSRDQIGNAIRGAKLDSSTSTNADIMPNHETRVGHLRRMCAVNQELNSYRLPSRCSRE